MNIYMHKILKIFCYIQLKFIAKLYIKKIRFLFPELLEGVSVLHAVILNLHENKTKLSRKFSHRF